MYQRNFFLFLQPRACAAGLIALILLLGLAAPVYAQEGAFNALYPPPDLPEHEPAGDDYFSDAVFLGDSMMENIEMLDLFPTANFVTLIGMSPISLDKKLLHLPGDSHTYVTAYDVINSYPHRKIYILLGGNALDHKTSDATIEDYRAMMERMLKDYPDSYFYVLCPPSMTRARMKKDRILPDRYSKFRDSLLALAQEMRLYFIDLYTMFLDGDGYLSADYAAPDGFHLKTDASLLVASYIRSHTVDYAEQEETANEE